MPADNGLNTLMEAASEALMRRDYLACESLCLQALREARQGRDWAYYGRVLMPLQECRRQRRMIASEGVIRLGSRSIEGEPEAWIERLDRGCLVLTRPHGSDSARRAAELARGRSRYIEVLLADSDLDDPVWTLRSFQGPAVQCELPAPARKWLDRWLSHADVSREHDQHATAADWFLDATEALGDAALAQIASDAPPVRRLEDLERCLDAVTDHEILHQRLGDEAKTLRLNASM